MAEPSSARSDRAFTLLWVAALLGVASGLALAHRASARPAQVRVWVANESEKVRPDAEPRAGDAAIRLDLAGHDCGAAQVVVRPPRPLKGLRASAALLRGEAGQLAVALSRVATIHLDKPSGPDGRPGDWPDALIPDRDAIFGEQRAAFPLDVAADRAQAIFVEVCTPAHAAAGVYSGQIALTWSGGSASVPIAARVRGFDLPPTPPLATAFGFSGYSAAKGHQKPASANRELTSLYDLAALRRGITLFGGTQDAPAHRFDGSRVHIDWSAYDAEVAPFLDGTALPDGARWTAVELREPAKLSREQRRAWRRAWVEHFRERGWLDRLFVYVHDEPEDAIFGQVELKAAEVRADAPTVRRLVTTALDARLPSVDLWTPLINCFDPAAQGLSCPRAVTRERYEAALSKGARLFWYQSCASHGCDKEPTSHPAYRGWPSYVIDAGATAARAMGALAFTYRIAGELYYNVVMSYEGTDPWTDPWQFGGNGDGTLYYPGTPERVGGRRDIPIESLRLIQIQRGLYDHAALSMVAQLGDAGAARREADRVAAGVRRFSRDPADYSSLRSRLYDRIEQLLAKQKPRADVR